MQTAYLSVLINSYYPEKCPALKEYNSPVPFPLNLLPVSKGVETSFPSSVLETGFLRVVLAALELTLQTRLALNSDPPASASAGIKGTRHHACVGAETSMCSPSFLFPRP